jgi:DNA end-binding protein Ku
MPQAVWVGDLSFGLVNIPIKLYNATAPKRVRFHQYEAGTGRRIRYARVATGPPAAQTPPPAVDIEPEPTSPPPAEQAGSHQAPAEEGTELDDEVEVPWREIAKGYEVEPGHVVTVTPEELAELAPEPSRLLEVEQFVDLRNIDPVYFDKSYYVVPQVRSGVERPYWLLYRAMQAASKVAVGRFVMRTKEYLAAVRPADHILMLETMFYADEVRDPKEVWRPLVDEPSEKELAAAGLLIDALAAEWDPDRHRDEHRERLIGLLHSKAGEALVLPEPDEEPATDTLTDLMKALEASVEAAKQSRIDQRKEAG